MAILGYYYDVYLAILAAILAVIWLSTSRHKKKYRLPPGPMSFPILGIIPYVLGAHPDELADKLAKKYGKIFGGWMGKHYVVFINDYDIVKEAFSRKDDVFSDRPRFACVEIMGDFNGKHGSENVKTNYCRARNHSDN